MIRFGLGAVKGVGEGAVEVDQGAREQGGPFQSLFDFCRRVDGARCNRKVLEALVKAGAFDGLAKRTASRARALFAAIDLASERAAEAQRDRESGQTNLFALFAAGGSKRQRRRARSMGEDKYPPVDEWMPKELLAFEKESLGFYISGHPLDRYGGEIRRFTTATAPTASRRASAPR